MEGDFDGVSYLALQAPVVLVSAKPTHTPRSTMGQPILFLSVSFKHKKGACIEIRTRNPFVAMAPL